MENLYTIKEMYHAVASGDFPAFLNGMDENIEWNQAENFPYADGNPYIGPGAVAGGVFDRIAADWDYWTLSDLEYHESNDKVFVTGRYNAKNKRTEKIIKAQFTHIWTLKNSKATLFQQYADTKQVSDAMN
ncbi:MAG: nuclear transport factor 2 family protein [Chitinophagaceae bacterium]|nr:nuclear transport factor 2 family protein [Chitinophagaceae bacterium]